MQERVDLHSLTPNHIAQYLVAGDIDRVISSIEQVRNNYPNLMSEVYEPIDHCGRKIRGTLLQIAAMNCDFDYLPPSHREYQIFGAVERLVALNLLPDNEVQRQLCDVLGPASKGDTERRTNRRKAALEQLVDDLVAVDDISVMLPVALVCNPVKSIIKQLKENLIRDPEDQACITKGFIFDPTIFPWFIEQFFGTGRSLGWRSRLGGERSSRCQLLWVIGLGALQATDTACGLQLHRYGMFKLAHLLELYRKTNRFFPSFSNCIALLKSNPPDRSLSFLESLPYFYSDLGLTYLTLRSGQSLTDGFLYRDVRYDISNTATGNCNALEQEDNPISYKKRAYRIAKKVYELKTINAKVLIRDTQPSHVCSSCVPLFKDRRSRRV